MNKLRLFLSSVLLIFLSGYAYTHHAFVTHFDPSRTFEIEGVVTAFQLRNPHSFFSVESVNEQGETQRWEIELASAVHLRRMGISRSTFKAGDTIKVAAWPNRNPEQNLVYGISYVAEDGTRFGQHPDKTVDSNSASQGVLAIQGRWSSPLPMLNKQAALPLNDAGQAAIKDYDPQLSPANTCEPATIPDLQLSPYLTDIKIGTNDVTFVHEAYGIKRVIPLDSDPVPADSSGYMGIASASIEGDQLVIKSSDYPASRWGLSAAAQPKGAPVDVPSSAEKTLVERYSVGDDGHTLTLEYTLEDPAYLTQPYTGYVRMNRVADDEPMYTYECEVDSAKRFSE